LQATEKILRCPRCGEVMLLKEPGFWKCPICQGEFWPDDEPEEVQIRKCYLSTLIIPSVKKRSGGSRSRKRSSRQRKPLSTERYVLM